MRIVKTLSSHSVAARKDATRDTLRRLIFLKLVGMREATPRERSTIDRAKARNARAMHSLLRRSARETAICGAHNFAAKRSRCEATAKFQIPIVRQVVHTTIMGTRNAIRLV